jgi:formylglycine-generating enzyme required for sulfatase activity
MAEYARFLDPLDEVERLRRLPRERIGVETQFLEKKDGNWRITENLVEGDARSRTSPDRLLEIPALCINWFDATAFVSRLKAPYRLPTALEWDKAARGVDGRAFPMGNRIDPAFAKLRESRPEASQPESVGSFPLDVSPYGVRDLCGGVGDWTSTPVDGQPLPKLDDESSVETHERQAVWRGGAWAMTATFKGSLWYSYRVIDRTGWVGFRMVMDVDGASSALKIAPMR